MTSPHNPVGTVLGDEEVGMQSFLVPSYLESAISYSIYSISYTIHII